MKVDSEEVISETDETNNVKVNNIPKVVDTNWAGSIKLLYFQIERYNLSYLNQYVNSTQEFMKGIYPIDSARVFL